MIGRKQFGCPFRIHLMLSSALIAAVATGEISTDVALDSIKAAETAFQDQLYLAAEKQCRLALQSSTLGNNDKERATLLLLDALAQQQSYDELLRVVKQSHDLVDTSSDPGIYWYWEGVALQGLNRVDDLLKLTQSFRHKFDGNPHFAQMRHLEAIAMARANRIDDSLTVYAQTAKLEQPEEDRAMLLLDWGQTLLANRQTQEAEAIFQNVTELSGLLPPVQEAYFRLAQINMLRTNWSQAIGQLNTVTNLSTEQPNLLAQAEMALAESLECTGQTNHVVDLLQEAHDRATDPTLQRQASIQRGLLLVRLGNVNDGIALVQGEISRSPNHPFSRASQLSLANTLMGLNNYTQALTEYQKHLDTYETDSPDGLIALEGRGRALTHLGRFPEAARSFQRAYLLSKDPVQRAEFLFMEADSYFANRQYDMAGDTYRQISLRFPENSLCVKALFQIAECQAKGQASHDAILTFTRLATDYPTNPLAEEALVRMAEIHVDACNWSEAVKAFNTVMTTYTNGVYFPNALVGRGMAHYRMLMLDEAMADFDQVLERFASSVAAEQASYMRGICQYWMGDDDSAVETCQVFLKKYPNSEWTKEALFWLSEHEFNQGNFAVSETNFLKFADVYKSSELADEALLYAGVSAARQREYVRCISTLSRMPTEHPDSSTLPRVRMAQADAMMELADFSNAILLYDEVLRDTKDTTLTSMAWARKGDSLFAMGPTSTGRYDEAISAYQNIVGNPTVGMDLLLHGEYMIGRCFEAQGKLDSALDQYYINIVLRFMGDREKGRLHNDASTVWFAKAVFRAADLLERANKFTSSAEVLKHLAGSGLPGALEAAERANELAKNHPDGAE
jgi:TolA-binding protein